MKQSNRFPALLALFGLFCMPLFAQNEQFEMRQVACNLSQPWEITYGPDNYLWVTEAHSYQVSHVDPADGSTKMLLDLSNKKNFPNDFDPFPQGGLMGLALHPDFMDGKPYVYLAYVFEFDTCKPDNAGCFFTTKLVRYLYDLNNQTLNGEVVICDTIPGSNDHNGGRIAIGPADDGQMSLFYSVGDMAAGHLGNRERMHNGQDKNKYEGKILRFNLESDGDSGDFDRWIPDDNPFETDGVKTAVWSLGHRNPQGLVFGNGILYEAEHGPYSDDELNIIVRGGNYGFPLVMGFADGNYNGSAAGAGSGVPVIFSEQDNAAAIGPTYHDPIMSLFPASQSAVSTIYTNDVNDTPPFDNYYLSWPTAAPSGVDYYGDYGNDGIPGWEKSILLTSLKLARVYRIPLSNDGLSVNGDTTELFRGLGRFRDIAISPDGLKIYVSADSMGQIAGPPGVALVPPNRGCILEFSYLTTDVEDVFAANVHIFPNPASDRILLELGTLPDGPVRVIAYNSMGLPVSEQYFDKQADQLLAMDIAGWADGQYVLNILPENMDWNRGIMKKVTVLRSR